MAEHHGVAVGTLRKSLAILEDKGLLERVQGSGNYIRAKQKIDSVYALFRLELLNGGGLPTAKILDIRAQPKAASFPNFGASQTAHRITRLRYLDDKLIALEQIWLDSRFTKDMRRGDISESLYDYYKNELSLIITRMEDKISLAPVPDWTPDMFNMQAGDMAGYIERIGWDQFDRPAEFSKTWFNPKICHYVNRA